MSAWELNVFHAINGLAGHDPLLDTLARIFVGDYFVPVLLSLGMLGLWFGAREAATREYQQRAVLTAVLAVGIANLFVLGFNSTHLGSRPRPYLVDAHAAVTVDKIFYRPPDPTFPSNSMAVAFAIAAAAWHGNRRAGLIMGGLGAAMGLARVFAGVHYPGDVLTGIGLGIGAATLGVWFMRRVEPVPTLFLQWARRLYLA